MSKKGVATYISKLDALHVFFLKAMHRKMTWISQEKKEGVTVELDSINKARSLIAEYQKIFIEMNEMTLKVKKFQRFRSILS